MSDVMMIVTVTVVAVLVLIIVFMASERRGYYPYRPSSHHHDHAHDRHSDPYGPYYQHGGRTPTNGLLY